VYVADAACQALVPVSRSARKSAAPAESGIAARDEGTSRKEAMQSHFTSPSACAATLRPDRARLCTEVTRLLTLQAQLSRVKMGETPSQTSHDRNLSEGSIVGPYTSNSPPRVTAKDGFQQAPRPSRSAAAFFAASEGYFSFWWHGSRCEACARMLEHRPQRCADARPFAAPPQFRASE